MPVIIFGANCQDGYYLENLYYSKSVDVISVSRSGIGIQGDVANRGFVERLVRTYLPSAIFHLAANSTTRHEAIFENHATISTGTLNILESVKKHSPSSKVFITGSGLQFRNTGQPISENDAFEAITPYSVARIQSVYTARYFRSLGIRAYVGYLFHHESPLRKEHHVSKMIALAVQRIASGSDESIEIGDMSVQKEWAFAGDVAQGILTLVEQDDQFEATIGTGITYTIQDWLEQCFSIIKKDWRSHVRQRTGFTTEYKRLVSDPTTIHSLGWKPEITFHELAQMMVATT
ncbi:MAG: GDP-mannose 4,6-dehydratase [bacterium]|nr:GDP-mannose 4,6-dehydratase [bacterium]